MGSHQVFCLRWSNHQSNMLSVFDELLQSEALVDVTIACEGLSLKAHKVVLSACSPYFQALFVQNPCKHPIVILKDIKYAELKSLVDFMYKGEVNVTKEQLSALLKTAETLKIKGLAEVTGGVNGQHESAESLSRLSFPSSADRNASTGSLQQMASEESGGSRSPLHGIPYLKSVNMSGGIGSGGGSSSSAGRSLRSPLPKRKKTRHRKRSPDGVVASTSDPMSNVDVRGSPEMIVAKVEVTDDYDNVPTGSEEPDEEGKLTIDQGDDSNDSLDNLYTGQGPPSNPPDEDYTMDDQMSSLSSSQAPLSLIQKLKTSGPSTSSGGSNQGYFLNPWESSLLDYTSMAAAAASDNMCPVCGITFRYRNNLYRHRRTHCDNRVRHNCEQCSKSFSRKDSLQVHARIKHNTFFNNDSSVWKSSAETAPDSKNHKEMKPDQTEPPDDSSLWKSSAETSPNSKNHKEMKSDQTEPPDENQ